MSDLSAELSGIPTDEGFRFALDDVIAGWRARGVGLDGVEAALAFVEAHPDLYHGAPGPIVHFAEEFHGRGYEAALLRSFARQPTMLTAWMVNRLLNATNDPAERETYLAAFGRAASDAELDGETRAEAAHFLRRNG